MRPSPPSSPLSESLWEKQHTNERGTRAHWAGIRRFISGLLQFVRDQQVGKPHGPSTAARPLPAAQSAPESAAPAPQTPTDPQVLDLHPHRFPRLAPRTRLDTDQNQVRTDLRRLQRGCKLEGGRPRSVPARVRDVRVTTSDPNASRSSSKARGLPRRAAPKSQPCLACLLEKNRQGSIRFR